MHVHITFSIHILPITKFFEPGIQALPMPSYTWSMKGNCSEDMSWNLLSICPWMMGQKSRKWNDIVTYPCHWLIKADISIMEMEWHSDIPLPLTDKSWHINNDPLLNRVRYIWYSMSRQKKRMFGNQNWPWFFSIFDGTRWSPDPLVILLCWRFLNSAQQCRDVFYFVT